MGSHLRRACLHALVEGWQVWRGIRNRDNRMRGALIILHMARVLAAHEEGWHDQCRELCSILWPRHSLSRACATEHRLLPQHAGLVQVSLTSLPHQPCQPEGSPSWLLLVVWCASGADCKAFMRMACRQEGVPSKSLRQIPPSDTVDLNTLTSMDGQMHSEPL
jgi:hypothetical protein